MRVDANVSVHKPGTPLGTRCEIKNVNSVRIDRSCHRVRGPPPDRPASRAATRSRQQTRHWDEGDGRTHTLRTQGRRRRLPLLPRARPGAARAVAGMDRTACTAALPMLPAARRTRLAEVTGQAADSEAVTSVVERGQDDYVLAVAAAGGNVGRALVYVKEAFAEQGTEPGAGRRSRCVSPRSRPTARSPPPRPRPSSPNWSPTTVATPPRSRQPRASRRSTPPRSRASSTRPSPPTRMRGRSSAPATARRWVRSSAW